MNIKNIVKNNAKLYMILAIIILLGTLGITFSLLVSYFNAIAINSDILFVDANISYDESSNGEEITSTGNMLPISDSLVTGPNVTDPRVLKATFNVTGTSSNPDNTIYDIALHNVEVDCALRTKDLKWRLYKGDKLISREDASLSPTFDTIDDGRLVLTETQEDLTTNTDKYTFLLWISESCDGDITECDSSMDQSDYLGKEFSASIKVELSTKSKKNINRITGSENSCTYEEVEVPVCNTLTYNGNSQALISSDSTKYTLTNTTEVNAGTYNITAKLTDGYKWGNGSTDDKVVTCNIDKKDVTVTTLDQEIMYGNNISSEVSDVSINGLLSNNTLNKVSLTSDTVDVGTGKISTSNVKIVNNSNEDITSNYNIIKNNIGIVTINCANIAKEPNVGNVLYTGEEVTGISGGSYITISGNKTGIEVGEYKVTAVPNKNYCWNDNTTTEKEYTWEIKLNEYEIVLDNDGATEIGTKVIYGKDMYGIYLDNEYTNKMSSDLNKIIVPTKEGYTFDGYYTEENGNGTLVINTDGYLVTDIDSDIRVLYARWIAHTYTINFYDNLNYVYAKGTVIAIINGRTYYKANDGPALVGYTFNTNSSYTGPFLVSTVEDAVAYYNSDDTTLRVSDNSITSDGLTYYYSSGTGWKSGDHTDSSGLDRTKYSGLRSEVAQLLVNDISSTVSQTLTYGVSAELTTNTYIKTGYTFKGWSSSPTGEVIYTDKQSVSNLTSTDGGVVNLYAIWEEKQYQMRNDHYYYLGNTTLTRFNTISDYVNYGSEYIPQNITPPEGYHSKNTYNYFEFYEDGSYSKVGSGIPGTDPILVIKYYSINHYYSPEQYTITYNANGGSGVPNSQTKYYGTTINLDNTVTPTRTDYTFLGWSTSQTATTATYEAGDEYSNNESVTLYAVWEKTKYRVTISHYYYPGGKTTHYKNTYAYIETGNTITPSEHLITMPTGFVAKVFNYYYQYDDGSYDYIGQKNIDGGSFTVTQKMIVNIYYKPLEYTISYNANGGSGAPSSQTKYYDQTLTLSSTVPTRTNYTFKGWSTNSSATTATYSAGGEFTLNESVKLYAVWKDETPPILSLRKEGVVSGFRGWNTDGSSVDSSGVYTANSGNSFYSPYYSVDEQNYYWSLDTYTTSASAASTPNASYFMGVDYFDNNFASVVASNGFSSNGYTSTIALNGWTSHKNWVSDVNFGYGSGVEYSRFDLGRSTYYSSFPIKFRNFKVGGEVFAKDKYTIFVTASDQISTKLTKKYASGNQKASYFNSNGIVISGDSFDVTSNGTYTVYVADESGNSTLKTVEINKIDGTAPSITAYTGQILNTDPEFASGTNNIYVYNNLANGNVTIIRKEISEIPNSTGYGLEIVTSGSVSPGYGGFTFRTATASNKVFIVKLIAKLPVGSVLNWVTNGYGDGGSNYWITDRVGTGDWEEYAYYLKCGSSGNFSTTNYFYLTEVTIPVTWQIAYATVFDVTSSNKNYAISILSDNESGISAYKYTSSSTEPTSWIPDKIRNYRVPVISLSNNKYIWVLDSAGNINVSSFS